MNQCPKCKQYVPPANAAGVCEKCLYASEDNLDGAIENFNKSVEWQHQPPKEAKATSIDDYIVPDDKVDAVKTYYSLLRKKFLHIKQERLIRKVADYFHLQRV